MFSDDELREADERLRTVADFPEGVGAPAVNVGARECAAMEVADTEHGKGGLAVDAFGDAHDTCVGLSELVGIVLAPTKECLIGNTAGKLRTGIHALVGANALIAQGGIARTATTAIAEVLHPTGAVAIEVTVAVRTDFPCVAGIF